MNQEKKKYRQWLIYFGVSLVLISTAIYVIHYTIFRDSNHIFIFLIKDLAFLPIKVLFITLIVHHILSAKEKQIRLEKLHMIISIFFSQVGTKLLSFLVKTDCNKDNIMNFISSLSYSEKELSSAELYLHDMDLDIRIDKSELEHIDQFLVEKSDFLLRLLENQNILEFESFSGLLRALTHLAEELNYREQIYDLPKSDYHHLTGDIKRVYVLLVIEWLSYMCYLKKHYPYLFSLAQRVNPFDPNASPVIDDDNNH